MKIFLDECFVLNLNNIGDHEYTHGYYANREYVEKHTINNLQNFYIANKGRRVDSAFHKNEKKWLSRRLQRYNIDV